MADAWIVAGEVGEYSDHRLWPVAVFAKEWDALQHAVKLRDHARSVVEEHGDEQYEDEPAFVARLTRFDEKATLYGDEPPTYSVIKAPWFRGGFEETTDGE